MDNKCPVCGEAVKVVGDETKHYESVSAQTIKELQSQVNELRKILEEEFTVKCQPPNIGNIIPERIREALERNQPQSLSAIRNEVIEECAKIAESTIEASEGGMNLYAQESAQAIRSLKTGPQLNEGE